MNMISHTFFFNKSVVQDKQEKNNSPDPVISPFNLLAIVYFMKSDFFCIEHFSVLIKGVYYH